jgi:uncharacterized membrane protein
MTLLLAFFIGLFAGLRSFTAPAVTGWAVYLQWLSLDRPLSLIGSLPAAVVLTVIAVGELIADKLPQTPNRTAPIGLIARIVTGAVTGACIAASAGQRAAVGAIIGAGGAIAACFGGYYARKYLVRTLRLRDLYVALAEDVIAVLGSLWVVLR